MGNKGIVEIFYFFGFRKELGRILKICLDERVGFLIKEI